MTNPPSKILIVDDERHQINVLGSLLAAENYQVSVALSGEEAVRTTSTVAPRPDLILLDINLPDIDARLNSSNQGCIRLSQSSGTLDIDSVPPATTTSPLRSWMRCHAARTDSIPDAQLRCTV